MVRKITLILTGSLILLSVVVVLLGGREAYDQVSHDFNEHGRQNALLGANMVEYVIEKAVSNGILDLACLFDDDYEIVDGTDPKRYRTKYNLYFQRNISELQESFLEAEPIYYAYAVNRDGYIPVHSDPYFSGNIWHQNLPEYLRPDVGSVSMSEEPRVWKDLLGYRYFEYFAPIYVQGRLWGEFRVGIPVGLVSADVRKRVMLLSLVTVLISLTLGLLVYRYVRSAFFPLDELVEATSRMASGELNVRSMSRDKGDFGRLSNFFNSLADELELRTKEISEARQLVEDPESMKAPSMTMFQDRASDGSKDLSNPREHITPSNHPRSISK